MLLPFSCQPCNPLPPHRAAHTTTFLPASPRGLPFNRQGQSWCWDFPTNIQLQIPTAQNTGI